MRKAKRKAAESGRTLTSLLEEGLKIALAEPAHPGRKPVRLPVSKASGGTLPGVNLNGSSELEDRMNAL